MRSTTALLLVFAGLVASCSPGSEPSDTSTSAAPTTSTTTITVPSVSLAVMALVVEEWNSGDVERWRATFTPDAEQVLGGHDLEADRFADQYEFFAVLGSQLVLLGCEASEGERGDGIDCSLEATDVFSDHLGRSPTAISMHVEFVGDEIVYWSERFEGAKVIRSEWWDFAAWVSEINPEHGEVIKPFPGTASSAELALTYLADYFES